jgi:hypothetical protein
MRTIVEYFEAKRPRLCDVYIGLRWAQIEERPFLRRPRIPLGPFIFELAQFYLVGAVLGAARPECAEDLIKLCVDGWDEEASLLWLKQAEFHRSKMQNSPGPTKYFDLVMELFYPDVDPDARVEFILTNAKKEVRQPLAVIQLKMAFTWGIALGCAFPTETRRQYEEQRCREPEELPPDIAKKFPDANLLPFDTWQKDILNIAYGFVASYYPDQLAKLRLVVQE